jgi:hypothetical protein
MARSLRRPGRRDQSDGTEKAPAASSSETEAERRPIETTDPEAVPAPNGAASATREGPAEEAVRDANSAAPATEPGALTQQQRTASDHPIFSRMRALRYVRFNHSLVFFLYALVGAIALILTKSITHHVGFSIVIYFGVVALIMGSYFALNMIDLMGLKLRYDQLGDNLYYLGFVYTLGTLTHTLYIFQGDVSNIYEVISSFGIALSSTVLGVVLRIVAHMMRLDPHEVEDAVRTELLDLTSRLRASLDTVVRDLTIFGDQTRQAIGELQSDVSKNISGNVATLVAGSNRVLESIDRSLAGFTENSTRLNQQSEKNLEALVAGSNRILQSVDGSFARFTEHTARLNQLGEKTGEALTALIAKINGIEAPSKLIEAKLMPATEQIERLVAAMRETSRQEEERVRRLNTVTDSMNAAVIAVRDQVNLISSAASQEEIASRVRLASSALKEMAESVETLRDHMKTLVQSETKAVAELRGEYETAVGAIRGHNQAIHSELEKFRSLTSETQDALIELAQALKEAV